MSRLTARRAAMQLNYERLMGGGGGEETLGELIAFDSPDAEDRVYIDRLISGVQADADKLDAEIASRSASRELERIPKVVRSVLQIALYELTVLKDSPPAAVINEAVELAKRFGEEGDARFVNGVLGNIMRDMPGA